MSVIRFQCSGEQKAALIDGVKKIVHNHYLTSVFPNTHVEYKDEGKAVYAERLSELMDRELFSTQDTADGVAISFDTTEEAGFAITGNVYKTQTSHTLAPANPA